MNPAALAENQALRGWMWVDLTFRTVFNFIRVFFHYLAVLFHFTDKPKDGRELVAEAKLMQRQAQMEAEKFAKDVVNNPLKPATDLSELVAKAGTH